MKIRLAGAMTPSVQKAMVRANSYRGPQPKTEYFAGCLIQYRNDAATILPCEHQRTFSIYKPFPSAQSASITLGSVDQDYVVWGEPVSVHLTIAGLGIIGIGWGPTPIANIAGNYGGGIFFNYSPQAYADALAVLQGPASSTNAQKTAHAVTFAANNYYEPADLPVLQQLAVSATAAYDAEIAAQQADYATYSLAIDAAQAVLNAAIDTAYASSEYAAWQAAIATYDEGDPAIDVAADAFDTLYTLITGGPETDYETAVAARTAAVNSHNPNVAAALAAKTAATNDYRRAAAEGTGLVLDAARVTGPAVDAQKALVVDKASSLVFATWLTDLANAPPSQQTSYDLTVSAGAGSVVIPLSITRSPNTGQVVSKEAPWSILWNGGSTIRIYSVTGSTWTYTRTASFPVASDCIGPAVEHVDGPTHSVDPEWVTAWAAEYAELTARAAAFYATQTAAIQSTSTIASFLSVDGANKDGWAQTVLDKGPTGWASVELYLFGKAEGVFPPLDPTPTQLVAYGKAVYRHDKAANKLVFVSASPPVSAAGTYLNNITGINVYAVYLGGSSQVAVPGTFSTRLGNSILRAFTQPP